MVVELWRGSGGVVGMVEVLRAQEMFDIEKC